MIMSLLLALLNLTLVRNILKVEQRLPGRPLVMPISGIRNDPVSVTLELLCLQLYYSGQG